MRLVYLARFEPSEDSSVYVSFPDVPEAITYGSNFEDAYAQAVDGLSVALLHRAKDGRPIPAASAVKGKDMHPVSVPVEVAMKLSVIDAFRASNLSKSELARRLGKAENEARRILDPAHRTKAPQLEAALNALGKRVTIEIADAA